MKIHSFFIGSILLIGCLFFSVNSYPQSITLVDYGASSGSSTFGLSGWDTILKSANLQYTATGNGGLVAASDPGEFGDYRGISGTSRVFSVGERIVVTWYNNSNETFSFTSRISFTDDDEPSDVSPDGNWYTMRRFDDYRYTYTEIQPYSTTRTVFNITDSGVHKTDDSYSLVNINLHIEWFSTYQKPYLICDKIELFSDADISAPTKPTGLSASVLSDSKVRLNWNASTDDVGVVEYLIYMDGAVEGYSRSSEYTCVFLEPDTEYSLSVTGLDAAGNESLPSDNLQITTSSSLAGSDLIRQSGLEYLGAFALPEDYYWGGEAIAYNPDGDGGQSGSTDGFPGSLFVSNVNQPENGLIGEVDIPPPVISATKNLNELNQAATITAPVNIRPVDVNSWSYVDIWRTGLEYLPGLGRLYSAWSIHYTVTGEKHASISCCQGSNLAGSTKHGAWYIGDAGSPPIDAMLNDWLFDLPQSWADANCSGMNLVVGRCRDGGLSGLGPTLYSFSEVGVTPPPPGSNLDFTTLLEYGSVVGTDNYNFPNSINGYNHADDWREAVWLEAGHQHAVAFIGNKALGHNWYGYHGERMHHDWVIADVPHPESEFYATDPDGKGWRSHSLQPMIIFYDPSDLGLVAGGSVMPYEPQPYAALRIDKQRFFGPHHEIFSAAFDEENGILYVTEFVRDPDGLPIIHVWQVDAVSVGVDRAEDTPTHYLLSQNHPNPFNPNTKIQYTLPEYAFVYIHVFNARGTLIRELVRQNQPPGKHQVEWDGRDRAGRPVASGVYYYQVKAGDRKEARKMVLIR